MQNCKKLCARVSQGEEFKPINITVELKSARYCNSIPWQDA